MKNKLFISLAFVFVCICFFKVFKGDETNRKIYNDTNRIFQIISNIIKDKGGTFEVFGGKIISGFIIKPDFVSKDDIDIIILEIESLGFYKKGVSPKNKLPIFCKENSGFLIEPYGDVSIDYRYNMPYCIDELENKK